MKTRNLIRNQDGTVDMEIEHPIHGWIPFTASPNDTEPHGRELYAEAMTGALGTVEKPDWPERPEIPASVTAEEILEAVVARDGGSSRLFDALTARMADRKQVLAACEECAQAESEIRATLSKREPVEHESSVKINLPGNTATENA